MEQRFSNNSLDLETLQEFCEWEGVAVAAFSYFLPFCIILYLVKRMVSWVMPMMRRTALSSMPIS